MGHWLIPLASELRKEDAPLQVTNESSLLVHSMHDCIVKSSLNHSLRKMLLIISPF